MRAVGTNSCMRFRARRKVDLPQPLGPIIADTAQAGISSETRLSTWFAPKNTDRFRVVRAGAAVPGEAGVSPCAGTGRGGTAVGTIGCAGGFSCSAVITISLTALTEPVSCERAHAHVNNRNKKKQYQRASP